MKLSVGIAVTIAVIAGFVLFFYSSVFFTPQVETPTTSSGLNLYANGTYAMSFPYSGDYLVSEGERGTPQAPHYAIILTHRDDADLPLGGEGPTTISIDIYPNAPNPKSLEAWLVSSPESNFALGPQEFSESVVSGEPALSYRWSGLYEGETTAFLHDGNVVLVSVTYLSPDDTIVSDYRTLLSGFTLSR